MPRSEHSDTRYEPTREDVLEALQPQPPNPLTGPDNPDPFGVNESPLTEYLISGRIAARQGLGWPRGQLGWALKRGVVRELLEDLTGSGAVVGLPRYEWAAQGRERPSRAMDTLYALPEQVARWRNEDAQRGDGDG